MDKKIVIGISGASGAIYAKEIINILLEINDSSLKIAIVITDTAKSVWKSELGEDISIFFDAISKKGIEILDNHSFYVSYASGSAAADAFIIVPCSAGTFGRIASGISNDLIGRIADVQLKERKQLIIAARESPLNLIHLRNLTTLSEAGAIIAPVSPTYYNNPSEISEIVNTYAKRLLSLTNVYKLKNNEQWSSKQG